MAFTDQTGNVGLTNTGAAVTPVTNDSAVLPTNSTLTSKYYRQFRWSPDGTKLLYVEDVSHTLYVLVSGQAPLPVVTGVAAGYPAAWSPDGTKIAYVIPTPNPPTGKLVFQVQVISLTGTAMSTAQFGAAFTTQGGCGGAAVPDPAEYLYQRETSGLVLEWTNAGFVYSMSCLGMGLGLVNQNNPPTWTIPDVSKVAVSADKTHAVGLKTGQPSSTLEVIDLTTGAVTPLTNEPSADQAAMDSNGQTILFTTVMPDQLIKVNPGSPAQQLQSIGPITQAQEYITTLWRVPVTGGPSYVVSRFYARGFGSISIAPDNSGVAYSLITSDADLVDVINQGATAQQARTHMPYVQVVYTPLDGPAPTYSLLQGGNPKLGGSATFTVIAAPPATGPTLVPTPTLVQSSGNATPTLASSGSGPGGSLFAASISVGQTVVVANTLNMRQSPTTTAPLLRVLAGGTAVTVTGGPQLAEGYRWWFIRTIDGAQGWVVDQIGQSVMLTVGGSTGAALVVGGQAQVAAGVTSLPMYATPGQATSGPAGVVATLKSGDIVKIVAGPQIFNNIRWWHVANGGGTDGWVYEQAPDAPGGRTLLLPLVTTPTNLPPAALVVGGQAQVAAGVTSLPMFSVPGQATSGPSAGVVATLKAGDIVKVVAGPQIFNNIRWWHIANGGGTDGWVYEQAPDAPGGSTLLIPFVAAPTNPPPAGLTVGGHAQVATGVTSLPMYSAPGQATSGPSAGVIATLKAGDVVKLIARPQIFNGIGWWHVANGGGTDGWVYEQAPDAPGGRILLIPTN